eukprot:CAMPEP_0194491856 /NCGR_PEP_ID=MMETSP0253-20130528/10601_1 /TAXON_ID=2966 /ORGANISM="Noctiluca scintillans" /LENGTH=149 /DNA_ID=CAMNT_0039332645 /DNA_START=13 /DNA_END=462 /DNA_ORIENTATION=+
MASLEETCMFIVIVMLCSSATVVMCFLTGVHRFMPFWRPTRKFDGHGTEEPPAREVLFVEHLERSQEKKPQQTEPYGSVGQMTPGHSQNSTVQPSPVRHPSCGRCLYREGFALTQMLRASSRWWGKGEPHSTKEQGVSTAQSSLNSVPV